MTSLYAVAPTAAAQDQGPSTAPGHCLGITFVPPDRPPLVCTVATGEERAYLLPASAGDPDLYVGVIELLFSGGQRVPIVSAGQDGPCDPWERLSVDCIQDGPVIPVQRAFEDTGVICLQEAEAKIDYDTDGDWDIETGTLTTCN